MSWLPELSPGSLTLGALLKETVKSVQHYSQANVPLKRMLQFAALRLVQHVVYAIGWRVEARRLRTGRT